MNAQKSSYNGLPRTNLAVTDHPLRHDNTNVWVPQPTSGRRHAAPALGSDDIVLTAYREHPLEGPTLVLRVVSILAVFCVVASLLAVPIAAVVMANRLFDPPKGPAAYSAPSTPKVMNVATPTGPQIKAAAPAKKVKKKK